jgi:hypothetical protein
MWLGRQKAPRPGRGAEQGRRAKGEGQRAKGEGRRAKGERPTRGAWRTSHVGLPARCGERDGVSLKNAPQARGAAEALIRH